MPRQGGTEASSQTHPPACQKLLSHVTRAIPGWRRSRTGDVHLQHLHCAGRNVPGPFRGYTKLVPGLYWCCAGLHLCCFGLASVLYRGCTGAVPKPYRGHAGTITAKCIRLAQKPAPGLYGASAVSGQYRPGASDLPHGCTGAVPELYRGRAGAVPVNLHGCPLLVSVLPVFPLPTVAPRVACELVLWSTVVLV